MFNLGIGEILVIGIVLIIFVGPDKLPTLMKTVGKGLRTLRQASRDIRTTVGLDELMRDDVLKTPPRLSHPTARHAPPPDEARAEAGAVSAAEGDPGPVAREDAVEPASAPAPTPTGDTSPAPAPASTPSGDSSPAPASSVTPPPPPAGAPVVPAAPTPAQGTEPEGKR